MISVEPSTLEFVGAGLCRPECVLTTRSGDIFVSDRRGGVSVLRPDGSSTLIEARGRPDGFLPNGIALLPNRDLLIANLSPPGEFGASSRTANRACISQRWMARPFRPSTLWGLIDKGVPGSP